MSRNNNTKTRSSVQQDGETSTREQDKMENDNVVEEYEKSEYEKMVEAKIARNQAYLRSLGFGGEKKKKKQPQQRRKRPSSASLMTGPRRRSARLSNNNNNNKDKKKKKRGKQVPQEDDDKSVASTTSETSSNEEDDDDDEDGFLSLPIRAAKRPRGGRRASDNNSATTPLVLSDEDRRFLSDAPVDLKRMERFLLRVPHGTHHRVTSLQNCKTVLRQVTKLVEGQAITYKHWADGVAFGPDRPVTLSTNFYDLKDEAYRFEQTHGADRGNGWLLLHPIEKLACFQAFELEQLKNKKETTDS